MDDALLHDIAERFGTPTYVYDLGVVRDRTARLRAALPAARLLYAVKANPNGTLVRTLADLGMGAEVITLGELERAVRSGIPPERVLVSGPGQDPAMIRRAVELGVALASLDSAHQWATWRALDSGSTRFLVRVNPGLDPHTHEHLATGAASSKFGLAAEAAMALASELAGTGHLAGFHVHAGSMIRDPALVETIGATLGSLYAALPGCQALDLGGGFAVPDFPLEAYAERARRLAERLGAELLLEPGRFLVAEAGTLLTRVLHVKEAEPFVHVIADAGMADLLRPALYDAVHPIRVLEASAARERNGGTDGPGSPAAAAGAPTRRSQRADVDGPLCENADRLGRDRVLSAAAPGALLAVSEAGAYGFSMASNYASSLRPAEVVVEDGRVRLARRRERPDDLWRLEEDLGS